MNEDIFNHEAADSSLFQPLFKFLKSQLSLICRLSGQLSSELTYANTMGWLQVVGSLQLYETYHFREPTNRSHPIPAPTDTIGTCVRICIYRYLYVYIYMYIHVHMYICMYVCICIYTRTHVYI